MMLPISFYCYEYDLLAFYILNDNKKDCYIGIDIIDIELPLWVNLQTIS